MTHFTLHLNAHALQIAPSRGNSKYVLSQPNIILFNSNNVHPKILKLSKSLITWACFKKCSAVKHINARICSLSQHYCLAPKNCVKSLEPFVASPWSSKYWSTAAGGGNVCSFLLFVCLHIITINKTKAKENVLPTIEDCNLIQNTTVAAVFKSVQIKYAK